MNNSKDSNAPSRPRALAVLLASCAALVAAHQLAGRVDAMGIPTTEPLFYGGTVVEDGQPVEGVHAVTVNVWGPDVEEGVDGELLCTTDRQRVDVQRGHFRIEMPPDCVAAIRSQPDIQTEVVFAGESMGRARTGAVPYAVQAAKARLADVAARARESRGDFSVPGALSVTGDVAARTATLGSTDARWLQVGAGALDVTDDGVSARRIEVSPNGLSPKSSTILQLAPSTSGEVTMRAEGAISSITIQAQITAPSLTVEGDAQFDVGPTVTVLTAAQDCTLPLFRTDYACPDSVVKGFETGLGTPRVTCSLTAAVPCIP